MEEQLAEFAAVVAGAQGCQRQNGRGYVGEPVAETVLLGPQVEEDAGVDLLKRFIELIKQEDQLELGFLQGGVQGVAKAQGHLEDVGRGNQGRVRGPATLDLAPAAGCLSCKQRNTSS